MPKNKNIEDTYVPVVRECASPLVKPPINTAVPINPIVMKRIIQASIRGAFRLKEPYRPYYDKSKPQPLASDEQIEMVIHMIESLQPADAVEVALASQFAITYFRGLKEASSDGNTRTMIDLFEFGHQVLEILQKYRSKGAQLISVHYNLNQGQVVNIKNINQEKQPIEAEVIV